MDPSMIYNPSGYPSSTYYYGGSNYFLLPCLFYNMRTLVVMVLDFLYGIHAAYDGSVNDWDRFSTPDGAEQVSVSF